MTDGRNTGDEVTVVAVDGPAGSGKSSVSQAVARRLGYSYLDTGAFYRALAWDLLERGIDTSDASAVLDGAGAFEVAVSRDADDFWVRVRDVDVTEAIRSQDVSDSVSGVARIPPIREGINARFRQIIQASAPGIVVEGRDITTVVAPDADVRVLLTAHPDVRARRRALELGDADPDEIGAAIDRRDAADSTVVDFLTAAPGVTVVDTSDLDFDSAVEAVLAVISNRGDTGEEESHEL